MLKQQIINAKLGRDSTTAVSQLQWSQSLNMAIENNNENGQTHYVKRYMTDR